MALEMYLEGLGFRSVGHILKISYGTVYQWVKEWGSKVELPQKEDAVEPVELDEMHTCVASKKTAVGYGLLLTDMKNGISLLSVGTGLRKQE
jgi:transposase